MRNQRGPDMHTSYIRSSSALAILASLAASAALAQPTAPNPAEAPTTATTTTAASDFGTDIVVTARKRGEERLQDIPASISAISGDALIRQGAINFADFAYRIPGLTFKASHLSTSTSMQTTCWGDMS